MPEPESAFASGVFAGSQVFGADDELSSGHGRGPEFRLNPLFCDLHHADALIREAGL